MADTKNMAIQYAMKKKKKMAGGGDVQNSMYDVALSGGRMTRDNMDRDDDEDDKVTPPEDVVGSFAEGGMATKMSRRDRAMMAMGGEARAMKEDDRMLGQHGAMEVGDEGEDRMDTRHPMDPHSVMNQDDVEDMVGRIMRQRAEQFAVGGEVGKMDDEPMADGEDAVYDDLDLDTPDTKDADYTGANSGDEIGNEGEDERRKDIVSRIMKSRALKGKMPNPA